jgi:hypothetical protein
MGEKHPGRLNRKNRTVRTEQENEDHGVLILNRITFGISWIRNDIGVEPMCATLVRSKEIFEHRVDTVASIVLFHHHKSTS